MTEQGGVRQCLFHLVPHFRTVATCAAHSFLYGLHLALLYFLLSNCLQVTFTLRSGVLLPNYV